MADGFINNEYDGRFELHVGDAYALADYRLKAQNIIIDRVEAPEALRGTGAASKLMQHIADYAKQENLTIIPLCSYAVAWFKRHQKPPAAPKP